MRPALPAIALAALLLMGCATHDTARCPSGEQTSVSELLYFGTGKPSGVVSGEEWAAFLAASVTPRFPAGLTVWPASGQWQSSQGGIVQEGSYVLNLVHPPTDATDRAIRDLIAEYKRQFQQEAVLRVTSQVCTSL